MSWEACAWATRKGKDYELEPATRFVMLTMANYADKEGNDIYPSLATMELDTGYSERTIRRHIKTLIAVGLVAYGDQSILTDNPRYRNDKLPKVYRFLFEREGSSRGVDFGNFGRLPSARQTPAKPRPDTVTPREEAAAGEDTQGDDRTSCPERPDIVTGTTGQTGGHSVHQTYNPPINPLGLPEGTPPAAAADAAAAAADETADEREQRIEAGRKLLAEIAARNAQRRLITHRPMTNESATA